MRLFGKYTFETLRDCLQGVFECYTTQDLYIIELWQIRFVIKPNEYIEVFLNQGNNKPYKSFGKILLS
jgi:hypothetical protein